jgi:putative two-component system response regulator
MIDLSDSIVMIVDDTEENVDLLVEALGDDFKLRVAMDGESALKKIVKSPPHLVLLDIMMPGMDGYEVCERLKKDPATQNIPIVFLTALGDEANEAKGLNLGAIDYIAKPFSTDLVKSRVVNHLLLKHHQDNLEKLVKKRTNQLVKMQEVIFKAMGTLAEYRDPETGGHIKRTQNYVRVLGEKLSDHPKYKDFFKSKNIDLLYLSAPLHDIGKVGVPDNILLKPGKLTDEEFVEMKKHTTYGYEAILAAETELDEESSAFLKFAKEIAHTHQEKWDGSGYPNGLKEDEIPISGRLMAVADVYDALISKRVYKPPFPHEKAVSIIQEGRGTHFDPDMVDAFLELEDNFRQIALEFADFDEEKQNLEKD